MLTKSNRRLPCNPVFHSCSRSALDRSRRTDKPRLILLPFIPGREHGEVSAGEQTDSGHPLNFKVKIEFADNMELYAHGVIVALSEKMGPEAACIRVI